MHRNTRSRRRIHRTRRPKLLNRQSIPSRRMQLLRQARALLAKDQHTLLRQVIRLQRHRIRKNINTNNLQTLSLRPRHKILNRRMMTHMLITIRHHRTTTIPAATPNNMDLLRQHRIRRAYHRANIQIMLPILNRHMKIMAARIQVSNNRVHRPVTVLIHHVTAVALTQQLLIPVVALGPRALPRSHTHLKTGSTLLSTLNSLSYSRLRRHSLSRLTILNHHNHLHANNQRHSGAHRAILQTKTRTTSHTQ